MKNTLLLILITLGSQAFAGHYKETIELTKKYFLTTDDKSSWDEGAISIDKLKNNKQDTWFDIGPFLADKFGASHGGFLQGLNVKALEGEAKEVRKSLYEAVFSKAIDAYFCIGMKGNTWAYHDTDACIKNLKKIIRSLVAKSTDVYLVEFEGDYYGPFHGFYLVGFNDDQDQGISLQLDTYYEI